MKILISDIWSVYNAGDRAILEGLLDGLRAMYPGAELTLAAHFPEGCEAIRDVRVLPDVLAFDEASYQAQLAAVDGLDPKLDALKQAYRGSDLVVSTGGYFLNATPGNPFAYAFLSRLLHFTWALDAGVPVAVVGQSLGPIEGSALRMAARATFARIPAIGARDVPSLSWMQRTGVAAHTVLTADLAVDLAPAQAGEVERFMQQRGWPRGALGISVRHYPGTPATAFRDMARVADRVVREFKVPVLLIGTTIPPEDQPDVQRRERELGNDDSLALREVHNLMQEKASAAVCTESLPPRLLKGVLATCRAFISTRMHAAILASTAGVPVGGIAYEFKVTGWFERLGIPDLVLPLAEMKERRLWDLACRLLVGTNAVEKHLARAIPLIQAQARGNFRLLADLVAPTGAVPTTSVTAPRGEQAWPELVAPASVAFAEDSAPVRPVRVQAVPFSPAPAKVVAAAAPAAGLSGAGLESDDPRLAWEKESSHYDVFHRRLRKIVELAEELGGKRMLDIGCSAGTVGAALSAGWTYHGCDVSEAAVRSARRGWLVPADLERGIPAFDEQPYDVVVCSGILEYLKDPAGILRAIRSRLRPGGSLIVSYFNMRHVSRVPGKAFRHPLWVNDYTPAEFRALLVEAGWEIERTTWSTAGVNPAPDVRDEEAAARNEPADTAARVDELGHTLVYVAKPSQPVQMTARARTPLSVVIPAFNRQDLLTPVLEAFATHRAKTPFEVVVVDDGSETPVRIDGLGENFRLIRQSNRGRAGAVNAGIDAARGEVITLCDSDIVPTAGFVDEHLAFHRQNPGEGATHLGNLVWGAEAGLLGDVLGARANPILDGYKGPVDWTRWFTDNWSFKRSFFDRHAFRFDTAFRKWGWEELELAHRLARHGGTNHASGRATGRHLKPVTLDGLLKSFSGSVPNLLHLARKLGPTTPEVKGWLEFRIASPEMLAACENIVRFGLAMVEGSWPQVQLPGRANLLFRATVMNSIFGLGLERGFQALSPDQLKGFRLPPAKDAELALRYAEFVAGVLVLQKRAGADTDSLIAEARRQLTPFHEGQLVRHFEARVRHGVDHYVKLLAPARQESAGELAGARR